MPTQSESRMPPSVRHAMAALDILRSRDAQLANAVSKILPGYAKAMELRGEEVSVQTLLDAVAKGVNHLKEHSRIRQKGDDFIALYRSTVAALPQPDNSVHLQFDPELHHPLAIAAGHGDIVAVQELLAKKELSSDTLQRAAIQAITASRYECLELIAAYGVNTTDLLSVALQHGSADVYNFLIAKGADLTGLNKVDIGVAGRKGHIELLHAIAKNVDDTLLAEIIEVAIVAGATDAVKDMLSFLDDTARYCDRFLATAACYGNNAIILHLLSYGTCSQKGLNSALNLAFSTNASETVTLLLANGAHKNVFYYNANSTLGRDEIESVVAAEASGVDMSPLSAEQRGKLVSFKETIAPWLRRGRGMPPPANLGKKDPSPYNPALFAKLRSVFDIEGNLHQPARNQYAYNLMAVLQSEERVIQYLKKWGRATKHPLHDITYMINLPDHLSGARLSDWGDAILKHGPKMARLARWCGRLSSPIKSQDGASWSYTLTLAAAANFAYARAVEHPALAALCFSRQIEETAFEAALEISKTIKTSCTLPDIEINGADFDIPDAVFKKLANDDVRGLFLGELTDCCQSIGNAGQTCAEHGFTSENGGFYVIETRKGEIIAQAWAWRGSKGELVLDSLETLGSRVSDDQWKKLLDHAQKQLDSRSDHNVTALHVGMGGKTPDSLLRHFKEKAAKPLDYRGYRDSKHQVRVWKRASPAAGR